jgi:hypothetical protein
MDAPDPAAEMDEIARPRIPVKLAGRPEPTLRVRAQLRNLRNPSMD